MLQRRCRLLFLPVGIALTLILPLGCGDSTRPVETPDGDGTGFFEGKIDPETGTFVLQSIESPTPEGYPIRVQLVGRNLGLIRDRGEILLEVAVRSLDSRPLYAPAEIIVDRFAPASAWPANADWTRCPTDTVPDPSNVAAEEDSLPGCVFGFAYSELLGRDGILSPGEISAFRAWIFHDPGIAPFSFRARARFALAPDGAQIAGMFFWDVNENGQPDPGEQPLPAGHVVVSGPGIDERVVQVGEEGRYSVPVREPGLYTLTAFPPPTLGPFAPVRFTTPNPLEVVLPPGNDGSPQSFLHAHFGLVNALDIIPEVRFYDGPPDSLPQDPYSYLEGVLDGHVLTLAVGYSGCQPEHPFQLFAGGFMESLPVQVRLTLSHDSRGELCDAWFRRVVRYDLRPIQRAYKELYGELDEIVLRLVDYGGEVHTFRLLP